MSVTRIFASAFVLSIISSASYAQFGPMVDDGPSARIAEARGKSQAAGCNGKTQGEQCTFQSYSLPSSGVGFPTADKTIAGTCRKITHKFGYGEEISSLQCE